MGESRPSRATAPACQLLTEQPGKDLQTMGKAAAGTPRPSRLCTFAGPGGDVRVRGELASVCSRSARSRRPPVCGKSPKGISFCRAQVGEGQAYSAPVSPPTEVGVLSSVVRVVAGFRLRAAAPDSSPSFFSSSGLHPSLVART